MSVLFLSFYENCMIKCCKTSRCIKQVHLLCSLWCAVALTFDLLCHCVCSQEVAAAASAQLNKSRYVNACGAKTILHEKISNRHVITFFFLFLKRVSGSSTTSSVVKPLGAGLDWKPVALTKNPTVLGCRAFVAAVKLVINYTVRDS